MVMILTFHVRAYDEEDVYVWLHISVRV